MDGEVAMTRPKMVPMDPSCPSVTPSAQMGVEEFSAANTFLANVSDAVLAEEELEYPPRLGGPAGGSGAETGGSVTGPGPGAAGAAVASGVSAASRSSDSGARDAILGTK